MIKEHLEELDCEPFIIISLNIKNEPPNITVISGGSLNKVIVHQRERFNNATSVRDIWRTNTITTSLPLTNRLYEASALSGIKWLDYLIIGDGSLSSEQDK